MVTCFHSSGSLAAPDILFVDMIYKIDYCIKGQPKRKSHMYTSAKTDEDAAFYALDWVVTHNYNLLNVSRT
jgi:hypothetical protein